MFFYSADKWLADPAMLIRIWEGGMSFHGGLMGVVIAYLSIVGNINFFSQFSDLQHASPYWSYVWPLR